MQLHPSDQLVARKSRITLVRWFVTRQGHMLLPFAAEAKTIDSVPR